MTLTERLAKIIEDQIQLSAAHSAYAVARVLDADDETMERLHSALCRPENDYLYAGDFRFAEAYGDLAPLFTAAMRN